MAFVITSREEFQVHRFNLVVAIGIPLLALFLQASLPTRFGFFALFDLPLLVTIFFAVSRRSQVMGVMTGSIIGIIQDSLTHQPLGAFGIAKTIVGYAASSIGIRVDVENPGSRLLLTFAFYFLHQAVYFTIMRSLVESPIATTWTTELGSAFANALLAVVLFALLDKTKQRS